MADEEEIAPSDEPPAAAKASVPPKVLRAHFEEGGDDHKNFVIMIFCLR